MRGRIRKGQEKEGRMMEKPAVEENILLSVSGVAAGPGDLIKVSQNRVSIHLFLYSSFKKDKISKRRGQHVWYGQYSGSGVFIPWIPDLAWFLMRFPYIYLKKTCSVIFVKLDYC
jgi:hypothetical protein